MPIRRNFNLGEWLFVDEESGIVTYGSRTAVGYDGSRTRKEYADPEHPQDFVTALEDPQPLPFYSIPPSPEAIFFAIPPYVGNTTVPTPLDNAAAHLFDPAIPDMEIGYSFVVR